MLVPRIRHISDRAIRFDRPAGTWRLALLVSIGLWALIASVATTMLGS